LIDLIDCSLPSLSMVDGGSKVKPKYEKKCSVSVRHAILVTHEIMDDAKREWSGQHIIIERRIPEVDREPAV